MLRDSRKRSRSEVHSLISQRRFLPDSTSVRLGSFIYEVGCLLATACESFVSEAMTDASQSISNLISSSQCNKARLLHYFSPDDKPDVVPGEEKEIEDDLCGIHLVCTTPLPPSEPSPVSSAKSES